MPQYSYSFNLHDLEGTPIAEAEVRLLSEGDLCIDLHDSPDEDRKERAIITIEARDNGSFFVRVMDADASLIGEVEIPARDRF
jgi:hypothetical protein